MSTRQPSEADNFYHVYNRGVEKRNIFLDQSDYKRFLALLYICNDTKIVDLDVQGTTIEEVRLFDRTQKLTEICAYCLMPNHYHLLIYTLREGNLSKFMLKLQTAYAMYFNHKYNRIGSLFQGPYKAQLVDNDRYLKFVPSYIHLNPTALVQKEWKEQGIRDIQNTLRFLRSYKYSSYIDYTCQKRPEEVILDKTLLESHVESPNYFETDLEDWLETKGNPRKGYPW